MYVGLMLANGAGVETSLKSKPTARAFTIWPMSQELNIFEYSERAWALGAGPS